MRSSILLLFVATFLLISASIGSADRAPPPGYYYEPEQDRWHYYDGLTIQQQAEGFEPPPGEGVKFHLVHVGNAGSSGWEMQLRVNVVGYQRASVLVESQFVKNGETVCPSKGCTLNGTYESQSYLVPTPVGIMILGTIEANEARLLAKPHSGEAVGWLWFGEPGQAKDVSYRNTSVEW